MVDKEPSSVQSLKALASSSLPFSLSCNLSSPVLDIMAEALLGGAFLSSFINVVFDRLSSPEVYNLIRGKKLDHKLLQRLETTLNVVQAVLNDAEQKQIKDAAVKKWVDDLKDAVYVADDLLDEVSTKAVTQREEEVGNFFSRFLNLQDREMINKLEDVTSRLEYIVKYKDILGLKEIARENFSWRTPSTSLEEVSNIYGRDGDKEAVLRLLLDDGSDRDGKISVIPIVGMGGVGKTTLAQLVYNDDNLKQEFDLKAWVCVSDEFDILKVTKTIIEAITGNTCNMNDLNLLQLNLKEKLTRKKFLIVMDDVWTEDYVNWNKLIKPFHYGMKGSKILVTTRSEKVASVVQGFQPYHLKELSNEDCWLVFANHACISSTSSENAAQEKIGREIIKKCKGLPLAVESIGGLLQAKHDIRDWYSVLKSDIWELSEDETKIIPALRISYYYLPSHLKRCFVYCSLYPKDYEFDKDELILLWMAEDFLQPPRNGKTLEEVGYEYFNDLVSRSFFQRSSTRETSFMMHDLMHDLATSVGKEFYLRLEELEKATNIDIKIRHLSYSMFSQPISKNFEAFDRVNFVRTFLPINFRFSPIYIGKAIHVIPSKFKYLRVLSFCGFWDLDVLPNSIGELIHLRYLDLSRTPIKTLPESLTNLYNLQTLKLAGCYKLYMLPSGMQNLVNLRHLDIWDTGLKEMPKRMGKLSDLQFLHKFVVGKDEDNGIMELGGLPHLHGSLSITSLENVTNSGEALGARMMDKKHIKELDLQWSRGADDFADSQIERDILDKLQPHKGLEVLRIYRYRGTRFPDWMGHSSCCNMTDLYLDSCSNCCMLPSLGQLPSLKSLKISNLDGLETIGTEFYKNDDSSSVTPFLSLESLRFEGMLCWQLWSSFDSDAFPQLKKLKISRCPKLTQVWSSFDSDAFPQLKKLTISRCPKLTGDLPHHLPALEKLRILNCEQLTFSLPMAPVIRSLQIVDCNQVALEVPPSLHSLTIEGSKVVEFIFKPIITNIQPTCLQHLSITGCSSAISFPGGCIPSSVKSLQINDCRKLEFPKQQPHQLLESLIISRSCDSLTSFPLDIFPNLKDLEIRCSENLESLSVSRDAALQNLQRFTISECSNLVSFPKEGLAAPNMTSFSVWKCNKLKSLPCYMNTLLPKLERLWISNCPEIESFPEEGLSPNLRSLGMTNCEKLLSGLASTGSLTDLRIHGPCDSVKSFPKKEGFLPASLTSLQLIGLSSLETLDCQRLLHLTSLQELTVGNCPKLENMAGERLPASLIQLFVDGTPLLEERIRTKHQEIWPKISHVRVTNRWIL